uniref:Uncharacterized protein n=1 Tax=Tanacetum cinerariifolium TaxID=118510 RepID=A0A6L2MHY0_TANCI|nr:hypothetical protein [Tanacetum cinerariifolium]
MIRDGDVVCRKGIICMNISVGIKRLHDYIRVTSAELVLLVYKEVIVNGDSVTPVASASASAEGHIPPELLNKSLQGKIKLKAKSTFMLAIPDEHLLKFHACKDEKSLWEAIKNRVGGNKESKKMQKTILKQNYKNFTASSQEGLDKTYDRFQKLISQLEIHDTLSMDDLYNNLKVYESKIKIQSSSSSNSHNVAFVFLDNSSSTNETINTAQSVSAASSKDQASTASYADDVMFSFFSNQSNAPQLDNEDLEQIDTDDLEEMDLKWQVAMLNMRVKRFIKKTKRKLDLNSKETVGFDRTKVEEELKNFALIAYTSQGSSSSDSKVHTCSKECLKSYKALQKQYDQQREALNKSNIEIIGYQIGLESLEDRIVVHEKNKAIYEEYIAFLKYDVQVKDISIKEIKNQLENALKEKDDLKLKLEKFETSSKNLTKLINSQISAIDKTGLGYDGQMNDSNLNDIHVNESEVLNFMFDSHESDGDDNQVNDRFKKGEGYHAVLPPYTGNYMPLRADLSFVGLDNSVFKSKVSKTITSVPKIETNASKTSKDSLEKLKTVRSSASLIEEWESDSEDKNVFKPKEVKKTVKPSLEKIEFVNARNTNVENENKAEKPRKVIHNMLYRIKGFGLTFTDKNKVIITEASIKRDLRFEDEEGVDCLPNEVIFEQLTLMGHNAIFVISSHTKKVFANMKREGNDFSGKVTPLFETMMVQALEDMGEGLEIPTDPCHTPIITQPSFFPS